MTGGLERNIESGSEKAEPRSEPTLTAVRGGLSIADAKPQSGMPNN
jgi:hypothetical protein